jgi:hypothetical protein
MFLRTGLVMDSRAGTWAACGAASGVIILVVCGLFSFELPLARYSFALSLGTVALAAVSLLWQGKWFLAGLVVLAFLALLRLSFLPVYVNHWVPRGGWHRHTIWEVGHNR